MSALSAIKAILEADATLLAAATGGIWDLNETGRMGISRTGQPTAFTNGIIKPCLLVKSRTYRPDGSLADDAIQYVSTQEFIEVWTYQDSGFVTIETMLGRVFVLLHGQQIEGTFRVVWQGDTRPGVRDDDLDANVVIANYMAVAKRSV